MNTETTEYSRSQQPRMGILRNFREVVGNLRHKKATPKLCPRCGSPKIGLSTRFDVWLFPEQYICQQCGYKGPVTLELEQLENQETHKTNQNSET